MHACQLQIVINYIPRKKYHTLFLTSDQHCEGKENSDCNRNYFFVHRVLCLIQCTPPLLSGLVSECQCFHFMIQEIAYLAAVFSLMGDAENQ